MIISTSCFFNEIACNIFAFCMQFCLNYHSSKLQLATRVWKFPLVKLHSPFIRPCPKGLIFWFCVVCIASYNIPVDNIVCAVLFTHHTTFQTIRKSSQNVSATFFWVKFITNAKRKKKSFFIVDTTKNRLTLSHFHSL